MNSVADRIFLNGKIHTMDKNCRVFNAMALSRGKIVALGSDAEILPMKGENTEVIELKGKTVIPGIIETHSHLFRAGLSELESELFIPQSVEELLNYIQKQTQSIPKSQWMYFRNTYPTRLKEYRYPTLKELDMAAPNNPVYVDGAYTGQLNSYALKLIGNDKNTSQPTIGKVMKDMAGRPTGLVFQCRGLVKKFSLLQQYDIEDYKLAVKNIQYNYNHLGITSVIDGISDETGISAINELFREGSLNLRVIYTMLASTKEEVDEQVSNMKAKVHTPLEWGKLGFFKVMIDGGILTGTAYMRNKYQDDIGVFGIDIPEFCGVINFSSGQLTDFIDSAYRSGLIMTAHCIGDAATDVFLNAYETYCRKRDITKRRFSIIHCDFTDRITLKRIENLGLSILFQPAWHYKDGDLLSKVLGREAINSFLPYKQYVDLGISAAAGSDHMVKYDSFLSQNPYNPFLAMYNMVTRKTQAGTVIGAEHAITREEALRMYTTNAAYVTFDEKLKGSLEAGKAADFAVLSDDYFACSEENIPCITSVYTVVGGKTVYND